MLSAATLRFAILAAACVWPAGAWAQDRASDAKPPSEAARRHGGGRIAQITPYIEASQVLSAELSPGNDTVTYSAVAVGADATVAGRNNVASASVRYERRFAWQRGERDSDAVSGLVRASTTLVPHAVKLEAGALAQRTRIDGSGAANTAGLAGDPGSGSQVYAGYIAPAVHTMAGDVEVAGGYRFGYTWVETPKVLPRNTGARPADLFGESTGHTATVRAGVRPNVVAPIGFGVGAGWDQQNVSNLDQRVQDVHVRGDATYPVSPTVALVAGVGYENVEVSSRDAVRTAGGTAVVGTDGRYLTDAAAPRRIAYQTEGLIWDAGVMWRPSRRTSLEAYVGRRYGTFTGWGTFAYAPDHRTSINVSVYDDLTGFGGLVTNTLASLPTQFDAFRNPITGELNGCVANTSQKLGSSACVASALSSVRSAVFRSRGIGASYALDLGRVQVGAGAGYDRRQFIAAQGTVLASADGRVDQTVWLASYATIRLDRVSSVSANTYVSWFESGFALDGETLGYSTSLAYSRRFLDRLTGTAAVGLDGVDRDQLPDLTTASALVGLRYSF